MHFFCLPFSKETKPSSSQSPPYVIVYAASGTSLTSYVPTGRSSGPNCSPCLISPIIGLIVAPVIETLNVFSSFSGMTIFLIVNVAPSQSKSFFSNIDCFSLYEPDFIESSI